MENTPVFMFVSLFFKWSSLFKHDVCQSQEQVRKHFHFDQSCDIVSKVGLCVRSERVRR